MPMKLGPYRFAPPWWAALLAVVVAAILCSLGVWQIQRAHYKERLLAEQQAAQAGGPTMMQPGQAASSGDADIDGLDYGARYIARGHYDADHQILLRDQPHGPQNGYRVWTPFILDNGIRIMVDRGWVPAGAPGDKRAPPNPSAPATATRIQGFWRSLPQPPVTSSNASDCAERDWPRALSYPGAATVRCQYQAPVANGLLLLDPDAPNGFVRDWEEDEDLVGLKPFGHYAYASQWFLMAFVVGVIFVVVNLKRDKP